ncbi:MAG: NAD(P)/FAD-dependent oxidoreductase [Eubacterium sp.]|nr:NAD(P)/FAD-dependent oxidoreductase [Eubacterium sp.]
MPRISDLPSETDVIVVGAGAAGLIASVYAASGMSDGNDAKAVRKRVLLIEKNDKTGKKIYITGKGRCNFTNACDTEDVFRHVVTNAKFLYSSVYGFTNHDVIRRFSEWGLKVKEERGGRMFPISDHASDVTRMLERKCDEQGVLIALGRKVIELIISDNRERVTGVRLEDGTEVLSPKVILATGGLSYPSTGSTGDGYRMCEAVGHEIIPTRPGLTGINTLESWVQELQGLTLINTSQVIYDDISGKRKRLMDGFGEVLFTHFGVSGPFVLTASSVIGDVINDHPVSMEIDIKPALDLNQLDERLLREIASDGKKSIGNLMNRLLPPSLTPVLMEVAGVDQSVRGVDLTREDRLKLVKTMKSFRVTLTGTRGFEEAVITRGGVSVKEVNPHTMESKKISGLYFAGEILDVDALTGGYNLQIAWSTGHQAGTACSGPV